MIEAMRRVGIAIVVLAAAGAALAKDAPAPSVVPGPEHGRLTALCGTYDVTLTFWFAPGSVGVPAQGTSTIRELFNGTFTEERIEGTLGGTPFTTLSWTGFDAHNGKYEATRIATTNTARINEVGAWNEAEKQLELKASFVMGGEPWTQRTVIRPGRDSMVAESWLGVGGKPEWKGVEIRYTRRPAR